MDPLVRASLAVRSLARRGHGLLAIGGFSAWLVAGGARSEDVPLLAVAAFVWAVLMLSRVRRKLREAGDASTLLDFEVAAFAAVALDALLLRYDGGFAGRFYPAVYLLLA